MKIQCIKLQVTPSYFNAREDMRSLRVDIALESGKRLGFEEEYLLSDFESHFDYLMGRAVHHLKETAQREKP